MTGTKGYKISDILSPDITSPEVVHTAQSQLGRVHIEVDHRVHGDRHGVPGEDLQEGLVRVVGSVSCYLLWRNIEGDSSHVHRVEVVDARNNKEQAGSLRPALLQSPQPEYHCSLVLLNNLGHIRSGQVRSGQGGKLTGSGLLIRVRYTYIVYYRLLLLALLSVRI